MPRELEVTESVGDYEAAQVTTLAALIKQFNAKAIANGIVIFIPDTGKAKFNGSHEYTVKSGKDKGTLKMSKATFVVAKSAGFYGDETKLTQEQGDAKDLPLTVEFEVRATPPNREGATVDAALNRAVAGAVIEAAKSNGQAEVLSN